MARISYLVRVLDEGCDEKIHLPGVRGYATACGWCDINSECLEWPEHRVNCKDCLQIVKAFREMRMPDGSKPT